MHIPFMRGRGLVARFSQYAGFRPKTSAKGKKAAADDNDDEDDDGDDKKKARKEGAPENGDDGDTGDQEELASEDDDEKMEDDEDDEKMSDDVDSDEDDEDKPKNKKGKKAKRAAADDDDEKCEDDDGDKKAARRRLRASAFREGQRAQRARWSKVLSSSHAANNLDTALRLLSNTSLHSRDVIAELKKVGASTTSRDRRDGNPRIDTRGRDAADLPVDQRHTAGIQASWAKAFAPTIKANANG